MCRIQSIRGHKFLSFYFIRMRVDGLIHSEDGISWRWKAPETPRAQPSIQCTGNKRDSWINPISLPPCPASRKSLKHLCLAASVPQRSSDERTGRTQNMNAGWNSSPPYLDTPYLLLKLSSQLWFNFAGRLRKSLVYHPGRVLHLLWPFLCVTLNSALGIFNLFTMIHISPLPKSKPLSME